LQDKLDIVTHAAVCRDVALVNYRRSITRSSLITYPHLHPILLNSKKKALQLSQISQKATFLTKIPY